MDHGFLSQKGGGGGRGVKEKQQCLANVAEKNTVVVSSLAVDEPMDATVNIEDVNVGQTNSPTVNPKPDSRQEYPPINFAELGITSCMRQVPDVNVVNIINDYSNLGPAASTSTLDETVAKDKQSPLVNTTGLGSYPPLPTQETTSAGNAPGKSSYANVTSKPSGKKVNFCTLFTLGGNEIDVVVPMESIRAISERFVNTAYGFLLGKRVAYPIVAN
ncbi:hypothetical protein Tco_1518684 [Tanacetum coccineum]